MFLNDYKYNTDVTNVLVIGAGGAGLRAAIEVKMNSLSVKVLGKRHKEDAHTVLAAGGINAAFGNLDKEDSWQSHFADTYFEGYGIGNPKAIEIMAKESPNDVLEIDEWGANFQKLSNGKLDQRFFGAHSFRRTCFSGDFTGQSILNALLKKTHELKINIHDDQYVTDLLVEGGTCFGAFSFNTKTGEKTAHLADAVILATGGHTRIWKKSSSRRQENNGDGFYLASKAGCKLIDMEMVQFHPTGMLYPSEIEGTLVTEAVRGEGGRLFNGEGYRFMEKYDEKRMELSTRDKVALANYSEIIAGRTSPNGGVFLDISHKSKDFIISKLPRIYKQFIEYQMLDISKEPMEVAPTAHYSMGGVKNNAQDHSVNVAGLFVAGEVAGGLHGANRLGGNSLAEILIFGKRSGKAASDYSKELISQQRSKKCIQKANENISSKLRNGNELIIPMQHNLRNIMWEYCGVVKNEEKLKKGLLKLKHLKNKLDSSEVRITENNVQDLINYFDLEASIFSAEATLKSSLLRKESRGAHQRSDYHETKKTFNCNFEISFLEDEIFIKRKEIYRLESHLEELVIKDKRIDDLNGKLIE